VNREALESPGGLTTLRSPGRPCLLTVCRGCCCGSPGLGSSTVAAAQLARLHAAAAAPSVGFEVRTSDCLGPCDYADVVVVQPSTAGRLRGGRAVWIGWSGAQGCTDDLLTWAAAGGPGIAPPPHTLELHAFQPARRAVRLGRARR
jgi:hypothetical protein